MKDSIVVDDKVVQAILSNPRILVEVPALRDAARPAEDAAPKKKCGGCGAAKAKQPPLNFMSVKRAIVALPAAKLAALKRHLDVRQLRVRYVSVAGETNVVI